MKEDTVITTAGRDPEANFGIVNPPVYHASTITHATVAAMREARERRFEPRVYTYGRHGTPTHSALEEAVAAVEGGERAVCLGSGLAAINAAILAFVETGDHILMADNVYSPARRFCGQLSRALRGRDHLFRPGDRRRDRRTAPRAHPHRICRIAWLAHLRDDGHPGGRRARA